MVGDREVVCLQQSIGYPVIHIADVSDKKVVVF